MSPRQRKRTYSRTIGNRDFFTVRMGTIKRIGKHVSASTYTHTYSRRTLGSGDFFTVRMGTIKRIGKHVSAATYTQRLTG
jgi:hypothetical protein